MFQQSVGNFTSKFVRNEINSVQILNIQNKTSEKFCLFFWQWNPYCISWEARMLGFPDVSTTPSVAWAALFRMAFGSFYHVVPW